MSLAKLNMVQAINLALHQEMEKDPTVLVMGEDVGVDGGVFRVTEGLINKFGSDRVIDTPLAESGIVGTAIGMAVSGLKPVAEIQFEGFSYMTIDQLAAHASRIRYRSRGTYHCPLVIRAPYGGGVRALEHHSEAVSTFYIHIPGLKVVIPSSPYDAKGLLISSIRDPDPVFFFEPKKLYRAFKEEVPEGEYTIPLGTGKKLTEGEDLTLIAWGAMVRVCQEAMEQVKDLSVELIDLRTLSPLDDGVIIDSVKKTGRAVIVHEEPRTLGLGAEIIARINEKALLSLEAPVKRVTGFDIPVPLPKLEDYYLPDAARVADAIKEVAAF
ncbi:MAG: alpha-ketoacid dehydrogenase subunit beta [Candidatus Methanoperedens sp.]|nr:alpha-ketoacid dehydrogenase subunit beta [Candidatus Methanoperedens sp.]